MPDERQSVPLHLCIKLVSLNLLGPNMLQLFGTVYKLVRIRLGNDPPFVRFLHVVFIALLVRKIDSVFSALEVEMSALHRVSRRLPAHKWIFPSMSLAENVPIHAPVM